MPSAGLKDNPVPVNNGVIEYDTVPTGVVIGLALDISVLVVPVIEDGLYVNVVLLELPEFILKVKFAVPTLLVLSLLV